MEEELKEYTVVGIYQTNGQVFGHVVHGENGDDAMRNAVQMMLDEEIISDPDDAELVLAIEGNPEICYAGDGVVSGGNFLALMRENEG